MENERGIAVNGNNCSQAVPSMCTWGPIYRGGYSHGVITIHYNLQLFQCPMNEDATRVHCTTSPDVRALGVLMTFKPRPSPP
jgi:hypothetical protein